VAEEVEKPRQRGGALLQDPAFDRPVLAAISRKWQTAIERHTFRNIRLGSTDLDRF
jgi:hypothetical protein